MNVVRRLHPREFLAALCAIDDEAASQPASDASRWRPAIALLTAGVCLLVIHYLKLTPAWHGAVVLLQSRAPELAAGLLNGRFAPLWGYAWWGLWHLIGYVLIPWLVIRYVFGERLRDYGLRWNLTSRYLGWYALLAAPILCFAWLASFRPDFAAHYPFYGLASRSVFDLLAWEAIYLAQFACLEFFFRGFMLHACRPAFGANAIFVMAVPYLMIHFPKPWLEATGAIFFGILLGVLALRSRSIWGGAFVHMSIALGMDVMALVQTGRLPGTWWP